jgi:protein AFG1
VFLPFIATLNERMTIFEVGTTHDYRMDGLSSLDQDKASLPPYLCPSTHSKASVRHTLEKWFARGRGETRSEVISVAMGRSVQISRSNDTCGWFNFPELCHQPLGSADYIAIASRFNTIIVENVPQLGGHTYNEARRFVILIDALYEFNTRIIIASEVPRDDLFVGFEPKVETHDGDEDIAIENTSSNNKESFVLGEGGSSSSSSTTMIRTQNDTEMEWSATGRIGVSLAQLSSVREVSFSFQRAASRLAEMASPHWGVDN